MRWDYDDVDDVDDDVWVFDEGREWNEWEEMCVGWVVGDGGCGGGDVVVGVGDVWGVERDDDDDDDGDGDDDDGGEWECVVWW